MELWKSIRTIVLFEVVMFIGKKLFKIIFIFKTGNDDGFISDTVTAGGFERSRILGVEVKFDTVEGLVLRFIVLDEVVEGGGGLEFGDVIRSHRILLCIHGG